MDTRENVIKGLEILLNGCGNIDCDDCCFYISTEPTRCGLREEQIQADALKLLKEQDGKPMIENEIGWNCPSCGMNLIGKTASGYPCNLIDLPEDEPIHFCPKCGQAVKWE